MTLCLQLCYPFWQSKSECHPLWKLKTRISMEKPRVTVQSASRSNSLVDTKAIWFVLFVLIYPPLAVSFSFIKRLAAAGHSISYMKTWLALLELLNLVKKCKLTDRFTLLTGFIIKGEQASVQLFTILLFILLFTILLLLYNHSSQYLTSQGKGLNKKRFKINKCKS